VPADRAIRFFTFYPEQMNKSENDKAPLFKSWSAWYVLVIGFLLLLIVLFSLFTRKFS
jgi:hypothetical protein